MSFFINIYALIKSRFLLWRAALVALWSLLKTGWRVLTQGEGPVKDRLKALGQQTPFQRDLFAVLRAAWPNLLLSKKISAYDNTGSALVTRASDVIEVLDREEDFAVVYEPKMREITQGGNFFLGMQNSAEYQRDVSFMRLVMRREDVESAVAPLVRRKTQELLQGHDKSLDLPAHLTLHVPAAIVAEYFGVPGPSEKEMAGWAATLFFWLFFDLDNAEGVHERALTAAAGLRDAVAKAIAERKASGAAKNDLIGRALEIQKGQSEFTDLVIRNNLVGMIIGAIPTISKASVQALDQLLDRPEALAGARAAAKAGNEARLGDYLFEALRFDPINPVIYRRANRDTVIARSTLRARKIKKGTMVFASNLSAMFDPLKMDDPESFSPDRPWSDYILWGYGLHTCSGAYINRAVIPAMLAPVLARDGLRRAAGAAGQIDTNGTPFPHHFCLEND